LLKNGLNYRNGKREDNQACYPMKYKDNKKAAGNYFSDKGN